MSPKLPVMAIYGGTFDPFHKGHEAICQAILAQPAVTQLRIIPCHLPALKADASASAFQRLEMLNRWRSELAPALQDRIVIDDIEIARAGTSYSVETLQALKVQYPDFQRLFVMGLDAWKSFDRWHQSEKIQQDVSFWVFARKGEDAAVEKTNLTRCQSMDELWLNSTGHYWLDEQVQLAISSTALRAHTEKNTQWLPNSVANYITECGLYATLDELN